MGTHILTKLEENIPLKKLHFVLWSAFGGGRFNLSPWSIYNTSIGEGFLPNKVLTCLKNNFMLRQNSMLYYASGRVKQCQVLCQY